MKYIQKYFPDISPEQFQQFSKLPALYADWNAKINVISRRDVPNIEVHHVLHSLAIARFVHFKKGTKIMDLGTGGGFPGIPLAIMFPDCRFHLVDSIGKKLKVVQAVADAIGIRNIFLFHSRAEELRYQYDFIVSRAVAPVKELMKWSTQKFLPKEINRIPNGLICLKGGHLAEELTGIKMVQKFPINQWFEEPYFQEKYLVYIPAKNW
jgi:16S rRNA (guanine527-N7)-methyltransferase